MKKDKHLMKYMAPYDCNIEYKHILKCKHPILTAYLL